MKLYLFAIGGSGARVLRSLTMLLASGIELPEGTELIPILLDPDQGAGNLTETVTLLKSYKTIRDGVIDATPLTTFTSSVEPLNNQDFLIPLQGVAGQKFKDYIGLNVGMSDASSSLIKTLFSQANLELDMEVGFKGNPNIGSIVLGQFEQSQVFNDFLNDFAQGGGSVDKRIFIISSIFGGTGASGFPTLLKSLRKNQGVIGDAHIGALSLQPYFAVSNDPESAIDSTTFYAKTRAALNYYKSNIIENGSIDDFYFIGDENPDTYENKEGGAEQRNDAHIVELAGALSIIHFAHLDKKVAPNKPGKMYEFGVEGNPNTLCFKDLGTNTEKLLARSLTALYLMKRYLDVRDVTDSNDPWLRNVSLDAGWFGEFQDFLREYEKWLSELGTATRCFAPIKVGINDDDNFFDCVELYPVIIGFLDKFSKQNIALYTDKLNTKAKSDGMPQTAGEMLNMLSDVSYDLCADKIQLPG